MSLSFTQINASLCTPTGTPYSLRGMSAAAGFSIPDSASEFIGYICPTPTVCYIFDIYNPDQNYDVYLNYIECNGTPVATTVGPQYTMSVCAQDLSVSAPGGIITNTSVLCVP